MSLDPDRPNAELLVHAYCQGIFPMADPRAGSIDWYSPDPRAVIPLDAFHAPRSVARLVRGRRFELRTDTCFERVVRECGAARPGREETWLDERLIDAYLELAAAGCAHSVEAWRDGELVGGLYGVHLGGAFFGESMFSRPERGGRDSSKVCLVALVGILRESGFGLLDTQFATPHLERFGCVLVPRGAYLERLQSALARRAGWPRGPGLDPTTWQSAREASPAR